MAENSKDWLTLVVVSHINFAASRRSAHCWLLSTDTTCRQSYRLHDVVMYNYYAIMQNMFKFIWPQNTYCECIIISRYFRCMLHTWIELVWNCCYLHYNMSIFRGFLFEIAGRVNKSRDVSSGKYIKFIHILSPIWYTKYLLYA